MSHAALVDGFREVFHKADARSIVLPVLNFKLMLTQPDSFRMAQNSLLSFLPFVLVSKLQPVRGSRWIWLTFACEMI